jgi:hypothetical protein
MAAGKMAGEGGEEEGIGIIRGRLHGGIGGEWRRKEKGRD